MKITRNQLRKIIKEEVSKLNESRKTLKSYLWDGMPSHKVRAYRQSLKTIEVNGPRRGRFSNLDNSGKTPIQQLAGSEYRDVTVFMLPDGTIHMTGRMKAKFQKVSLKVNWDELNEYDKNILRHSNIQTTDELIPYDYSEILNPDHPGQNPDYIE